MVSATAEPDLDTSTAIDLDFLLILDNWDAPHCEAFHTDPENLVCTHVPVARYNSCLRHHIPVCQAAVNYVELKVAEKNSVCADCGIPCKVCWYLEPLNMGA